MASQEFAVLQLSGCSGCEVSLLNADAWLDRFELLYMPLVASTHDVTGVRTLLVSGGVRSNEDLYNLRRAARLAERVVAIGTCALSGGVASLGDRDEVRGLFLAQEGRRQVPHLLPRCSPVDAYVPMDLYVPGCPPTPELLLAALEDPEGFQGSRSVCQECGRKKDKTRRPTNLVGFQHAGVEPGICLINQGYLCVGTSTRGGCRAPCPRAGHPCVGCRGPSDGFIEKGSKAWFDSIARVFTKLTGIPDEEIRAGLRSPHMALFLFQFSDYGDGPGAVRPKEKLL